MTPTKKLIIENNEEMEMMRIYIPKGFTRTGKQKIIDIFEGNYWDFPREPSALKKLLKEILKALDVPVTIKYEKVKEPE